MVTRRKIVQIDEQKCDGCGLCVPSCAEGAIQIIDGKARLVSDVYCDGLGACLGHCPRDAISIIEREAEPFDEAVATAHAANVSQTNPSRPVLHQHGSGGCPGAAAMQLRLNVLTGGGPPVRANGKPRVDGPVSSEEADSRLANWPVQLHLVPPHAPYLKGADLLLVADCVPFAYADFHRRFLDGRPVVIGCPKLDDGQAYVDKLVQIIRHSGLRSITVVHMEVPCCTGLVRIAQAAVAAAGVDIPFHDETISIRGEVLT
jgi:Pyruvate/2-oxoacid:ferredoxin oxidoreductase delta subunit